MQPRCVIVSDGKRGHENQSRVLARMLGDESPLLMLLRQRYREGGLSEALLRLSLALRGPGTLSKRRAARLVARWLEPETKYGFRDFANEVATAQGGLRLFTVSTGTPPATLSLVLARMLGAESVVNMTPSLLPRRHFSLSIVPAHDLPAGEAVPPGVVVTRLALGYHDAAAAEFMAGQLCLERQLERDGRYWGVAIGGPSAACPWAGDRVLDELAALHGLARGEGAQLLVTTSRRTPPHCLGWLRSHYLASPQVPYFLNAAEDPFNPLPALYELCERIFVTGDSYSMICEAVHAGHRPVVLRTRVGGVPGKLGRALAALAEAGLAVYDDDSAERELPERLSGTTPMRGEPNVEYRRVAAAVRAHFGLPL